jgi:hypothetical protein
VFVLTALALLAAAPAPAEVALLCTAPQEPWTELRFQPVGSETLAPAVGKLTHVAGESVQGALLPGRRSVVAVAVAEPRKDLSFASHLYLLEPGAPPKDLADRVQLGARPYVSSQGRVFVARGRPGSLEFDPRARLRLDEITVDEVDLRTGKTRTVLSFAGYAAFVFSEHKGALAIYRVTPEGGEFVTVHPDALGVSSVARVPALARDFTVDSKRGAFVYTQGDPDGRWWVEELDVSSGRTRVVARGESMAMLPTVFPDGELKVSSGRLPPPGEGHRRVRAFAGALAIGLDERPDGSATVFAVDSRKGSAAKLLAPPGLRLDIAGVLQP